MRVNTTSTVTSNEAGPGGPATDTLTVVLPPTLDKAFAVSQLQLFGPNSTTLTFTLFNPAANPIPLTDIEFTDTLPAVVVVSTPNGLTSTCSPTAPTASPGVAAYQPCSARRESGSGRLLHHFSECDGSSDRIPTQHDF